MELAAPTLAFMRAIPDSFVRCLRTEETRPPDVARARREHDAYRAALEAAGVEVRMLPADEDRPDCCFVEDTAVVVDRRALITRPGERSRRGEVGVVADALGRTCELVAVPAPATIDGGDVLRVGRTLFVGLSRRTDAAGAQALATAMAPLGLEVVTIPVARGLHLKSVATALDAETLLIEPSSVDAAAFSNRGLRSVAVDEPPGANVLALGREVLVSTSAPRTAERIAEIGHDVVAVPAAELHRADGGLTCLSLRLAAPGHWCA